MDWQERIDGLDLDDDEIVHHDVEPVTAVKPNSFVPHW